MATQAIVLYEFEGDTDNGELVVGEGEVVEIVSQDIGDGWWEAKNSKGEVGLIPETYCELKGADKSAADGFDNGWQEHDEWDEHAHEDSLENQMTSADGIDRDSADSRTISPSQQSTGIAGRHGTVKKNINRFSSFVKTGTEGFILGSINVKREVPSEAKVQITASEDGTPMWEPAADPYSVKVSNPRKQTKYKGIKSFIAYEINSSNSGSSVFRRYKHYDWLHSRLTDKFTFLAVPPLPDKQYYGRYGEEFVDKRREKLEMWTNRIARHPVISQSDIMHHFLTCPENEKEWKAGKRKAEKDDIIAGALYCSIEPTVSVNVTEGEKTVERFGNFLTSMEDTCLKMKNKFVDHCNKMSGPFMAEWLRMGASINALAQCFKHENQNYAAGLNTAIEYTAEMFQEIGTLFAKQPKNDMIPTMDVLKEYLGMIQEYPDVVDIHRGAVRKVRDCERMKEEGRIDFMEASDITKRAENVSAVVLAEVYHFQHERVADFREMMKFMLLQQIEFYKEITRKLESALERYSESTDL